MSLLRLQKIIAGAGVASRRAAERLIAEGRVTVNGVKVTELGTQADPAKDRIEVDGRPIAAVEEKVYYMLNKPVGYVTTLKDPQGRPTVADLIRIIPARVFPVGRLDYDTSGLIFITNDGELANALAHPKREVEKTYHARVSGTPDERALKRLTEGVKLEDGMTAPARVSILRGGEGKSWVEIVIHEGRNRQVRRMCEAVGHRVIKLKRVSFGPLNLGDLSTGRLRILTPREVARLKECLLG